MYAHLSSYPNSCHCSLHKPASYYLQKLLSETCQEVIAKWWGAKAAKSAKSCKSWKSWEPEHKRRLGEWPKGWWPSKSSKSKAVCTDKPTRAPTPEIVSGYECIIAYTIYTKYKKLTYLYLLFLLSIRKHQLLIRPTVRDYLDVNVTETTHFIEI